MSSDNEEIIGLLKKRRVSRSLRLMGLLAIPAAVFGVGAILSVNLEPYYSPETKKDFQIQDSGRSLIGLGVICIGGNIYFNNRYKRSWKKAIQKYNQLYN